MSNTQYLNLNKPTGSDLVNPLTDTFPNWDIVDNAYHVLDLRALGRATELVSQGVHAITILDTDCKTIKWTATANFTAGDTFTVNGIQCNAYLPSGEALGTNAYVSGAQVIASLNDDNSAMTVYVPQGTVAVASDSERLGGELPAYYATKQYADGIKSTADSASQLIQKKALVNTFYDSSDKRLYQVKADGTKGNEINPNWNTLWTNSEPTSNFSAQTVVLDLTGYRFIFVDCIYQVSSPNKKTGAMLPNINDCGVCVLAGIASNVRGRHIKITSTGVEFDSGKSGDTTANQVVIPQRIYGIR